MQQQLIAIDLDGTTLNNKSQLSQLTIRTLRLLSEQGHLVSIVTGRPFRNSADLYRQLNIQAPMVNFNGALCHFPGQPNWLPAYHQDLDREIAFELFANQEELAIELLMAEGRDRLYTSSLQLPDSPYYPIDLAKVDKLSRESLTYNPTALTIFSAEEKQKIIEQNINQAYGDYVSVRTWGGELSVLEVVHKGINKAIGVQRIADFYRIPQANILAFGDEENDLEMLEFAGTGVAMKNGRSSVKAVANEETEFSNDQDGLARHLIERFSLNIPLQTNLNH